MTEKKVKNDKKEKNETLKRRICNSELMKEVFSVRLESLWAMINESKKLGFMPNPNMEGATSEYDNEGAMFLPGGYVVRNASKKKPKKHPYASKEPEYFRSVIRGIMGDNASLLYHDGYAEDVNLNNTMYYDFAVEIMSLNRALHRENDAINPKRPPRLITPEQLAESYTPSWADGSYGARKLLSSSIAAASTKPTAFYEMLRLKHEIAEDDEEHREFLEDYIEARRSIIADDGSTILAKPHIVVCHTQRHRADTMTGITKVAGYSKRFGEFSIITLDKVTDKLMKKIDGRTKPKDHEVIAEYDNAKYAAVLTSYPESRVGAKRQSPSKVSLISPERDLGMKVDELTAQYREKYKI